MHLMRCMVAAVVGLLASPLMAATLETRVPLHDGKLASADLTRALMESAHLKGVELDVGSIDMRGLKGAVFVRALNQALGEGCNIDVTPDALILHIDSSKLPHSFDEAKHDVRVFTETAAPDATARQRRTYGILLPRHVDTNRPMVVLVHGLDCTKWNWYPMADLLEGEGYQVAFFTYPSDGPLNESAALLAREMKSLHEEFPGMTTHIIAHSMGALVARAYVEGDDYAGGVNRLILLGPPNAGSKWANYRLALEVQEHYKLWKWEKDWSPTWAITDGLGEAARDLKPSSAFLKRLNAHPRREGVRYTIVAGSQNPAYPIAANALDSASRWIPALHSVADKARAHTGKSDGPVSVKSTELAGVDDYICLPVTHMALMYPINSPRPAAWEIIRDRLAH